jgi:TIR domain
MPVVRLTRVFVSYAREDVETARRLVETLRQLGLDPWIDNELSGGQRWWDEVLSNIRACDVFEHELAYAVALRRVLLPILVADSPPDELVPQVLAETQRVDFTAESGVALLARALLGLPAESPTFPDPMPPPPPVPATYLGAFRERVKEPPTSFPEQAVLMAELRALWRQPESRAAAIELVMELRSHRLMLAGSVVDDIDDLLSGSADDASESSPSVVPEAGPSEVTDAGSTHGPAVKVLTSRLTKKRFLLSLGGEMHDVEISADRVRISDHDVACEVTEEDVGALSMMTDKSYEFGLPSTEGVRRIKVRLKFVKDYHWVRAWQVTVDGRVVLSEGSFTADTQ